MARNTHGIDPAEHSAHLLAVWQAPPPLFDWKGGLDLALISSWSSPPEQARTPLLKAAFRYYAATSRTSSSSLRMRADAFFTLAHDTHAIGAAAG